MEDFKSKRKNAPRNPYLFLGLGIAIGVLLTAGILAFFYFWGQPQPVVIYDIGTPTAVPYVVTAESMSMMPTPAPTVVAARVNAAAVSPDGRFLATTATDDTRAVITLTELASEEELSGESIILYQEAAGNYFDDLLFSPDGSYLVATINEGIAILFDVKSHAELGRFPNIGGAAFNADGSLLALVGANNGIRLIDTRSMELVGSTSHDAYEVGAVSISSKNQLAIALDNRVEIYEIADLLNDARADIPPRVYQVDSSFAYDIAFHPSGDYLAVSGDGFVQILYLQDDTRKIFNFTTPYILALAFSPSGEWLAVAGGESGYGTSLLTVFRWDDSDVLHPDPAYYAPITLVGHQHTIYDVAFTPNDYLLSASWDGTVRLWDLNTREEISQMQP